tara:strand:- start:534 stop:1013 length:480 start_codon:yes stop_codon:yes gene_type:complete
MSFWSNNTLEPLRKFRFQIQIGEESTLWYAKNVTQPSFEVSMSEYQLINHKIKYPGIVTWNDIEITIVDVGEKGKGFYKKLTEIGYNPTGDDGDGVFKNQYNGESDFVITKLKADGTPLETWKLKNPFIKAIKYGDLDYSSDDLLEITITVAYDTATLT